MVAAAASVQAAVQVVAGYVGGDHGGDVAGIRTRYQTTDSQLSNRLL